MVEEAVALLDADVDKEGEHELVLLEEAAAAVDVDSIGEEVDDVDQPLLKDVRRRRVLDPPAVQVHEPAERVLVHRVNGREICYCKVEDRRAESNRRVLDPCLVNLLLRHLGILQLLRHLRRSLLRLCKGVDQGFVLQDVSRRFCKQLEDVALDFRHLFDHGCIVHHQLVLHLRKIGPLLRHDDAQELLDQPILGDCKVEQRDFDSCLRRVVRVPQLGRDIE
mmetsp:Transcript_26744/g.54508  ORF Transcript_26744/g.54508 Transcript_26744/m.54508 type:complete len:222 (+) Transcript_26744:244-909(+)